MWQKKASNDRHVGGEKNARKDVKSVRLFFRDFQSSFVAPIAWKGTRANFDSPKLCAEEVTALLDAARISRSTKCFGNKYLCIVSGVSDAKLLKLLACLRELLH